MWPLSIQVIKHEKKSKYVFDIRRSLVPRKSPLVSVFLNSGHQPSNIRDFPKSKDVRATLNTSLNVILTCRGQQLNPSGRNRNRRWGITRLLISADADWGNPIVNTLKITLLRAFMQWFKDILGKRMCRDWKPLTKQRILEVQKLYVVGHELLFQTLKQNR